jgi:DNA topoisomerase-6 subunit B
MAPKKNASGGVSGQEEVQVQKSPAEFFAENQAIAGFDNMGKSLYTSIRELMENSLDACESIGVLPTISVNVQELTKNEFNKLRGISVQTKDVELFRNKKSATATTPNKADDTSGSATKSGGKTKNRRGSQEAYFRISVQDNGCGMKHEKIPDLLGRVLSGSKYGVRQTRGKFGLGAKMALIWSKKSTGVPITITTSHRPKGGQGPAPSHYSTCTLDIDITKNEPRIIEHKKQSNAKEQWVGTTLEILIAGNWTTYKARIFQYLQQLAVITPYAQLEMTYENLSEPQRNISIRYDRRSEQMPPPGQEVKHHPSSVNNLVIQQLLERTKQKSLTKFLEKELSSVAPSVAKRIVAECGWDDDIMGPKELTDRETTKLVQVLRTVQMFKAPDGSCLSPLGEYNLNLGIRKVLEPDFVATARDRPCAYEGHPFLVEAAVSLGGKDAKEGITVVRFANRIPLLFEGGADVSTRVAQTKIKWSQYKIDHKRDKIGVFVSIVSTKIPYKGTGKEYIGDDITEISTSVKRALQTCCQQLRTHLQKRNALRDQKERKSRLTKYIPDVTRALHGLLQGMRTRHAAPDSDQPPSPRKRPRHAFETSAVQGMIAQLESGDMNEALIRKRLEEAVNVQNSAEDEEAANNLKKNKPTPLYIAPLFDIENKDAEHDIEHPLFTFRPIHSISP